MKKSLTRKLLLASASALAVSGTAFAADLTMPILKAPPPPPATWAGFYLGVDGGVARHDAFFNDIDGFWSNRGATFSTTATGGVFGGYAGYNWQDRSFVYGLEADINGFFSVKATEVWDGDLGPGSNTAQQSQNVPWVATFRGRLGLDFESTLVYFTGGLAVGKVENSFNGVCAASFACNGVPAGAVYAGFSENATRLGWTAGVGVEHMFSSHWTLRGEFRYVDLGKKSVACSGPIPSNCTTFGTSTYRGEFSNTLTSGLVGIGYKF